MRDDGLGGEAGVDSVLDQALAGGKAQTVGRFRFFIDDERWEWSDEVQQMYGYAPGEMPNPTTKEVLSHKHPDDYEHVLGALEDSRRTRAAFSTRHRIIDKQGREHRVDVVGDLMRDADGAVIGTQGFYIDVTPAESAYEERISDRVGAIIEQRATIDHAIGMLTVVYGIDVDAAFELLKWISQRSNTKVRIVAERLVARFRGLSGPTLPQRSVYDEILMTLARKGTH